MSRKKYINCVILNKGIKLLFCEVKVLMDAKEEFFD